MGDYKVVRHRFCRGIPNTSTIPEKDLDHWTMLGEGGPLELLVLGPWEEFPLFFVFHFPFTLKWDRSTTRAASWGTKRLVQTRRRSEGELLVSARLGSREKGAWVITVTAWPRLVDPGSDWAAIRFFELDKEDVVSAKQQFSRMEKGLDQKIGLCPTCKPWKIRLSWAGLKSRKCWPAHQLAPLAFL